MFELNSALVQTMNVYEHVKIYKLFDRSEAAVGGSLTFGRGLPFKHMRETSNALREHVLLPFGQDRRHNMFIY